MVMALSNVLVPIPYSTLCSVLFLLLNLASLLDQQGQYADLMTKCSM